MNRRQKPRWVLLQESQEARLAAQRDSMKSPAAVIRERVIQSNEYKEALAATEAAITAFYSTGTDEELVARIKALGGRTAIRRKIIAECGTTQIFLSQIFGYAAISTFITTEDVQNFEARALIARMGP